MIDSSCKVEDTPYSIDFDSTGFGVSPTFGFEYAFTDHITMGAEVEYYYEELDGKMHGYPNGDSETTNAGIDSRVVLRFYF
ncbi:MAG: hypothetical protein KJP07_01630 [Desulfatitalea sp.]|nr:hypothetical protein [Desulfatitalea sp.]